MTYNFGPQYLQLVYYSNHAFNQKLNRINNAQTTNFTSNLLKKPMPNKKYTKMN